MIEVQHLTKRYGPVTAVDDVSFTVERGEILGFLGPNGAGKSTTMRMITGFIPPSAMPAGTSQPCIVPCSRRRLVSVRVSIAVIAGTPSLASHCASERADA